MIASHVEGAVETIALLCVAVGFFGFAFSGFMVNPLDIAPKYAGVIIGISNAISTTPGFLGPTIVGIITKDGVSGRFDISSWLVRPLLLFFNFTVYNKIYIDNYWEFY